MFYLLQSVLSNFDEIHHTPQEVKAIEWLQWIRHC